MKVLVIGGGGREHALVWKLRESPRVEKIWCAPGNGGIAADATCLPVEAGDSVGLAALAEKLRPDLTVIGPELPLVNGVSDALRARNLAVVGPSQIAAQLEVANFSPRISCCATASPRQKCTANFPGLMKPMPFCRSCPTRWWSKRMVCARAKAC